MQRASWIGAPQAFDLNQACLPVAHAFGHCIYLVGSALERRDFRDVDVRCMLADDAYDRLFPGITEAQQHHAFWSLLCSSISLWLSQHSGLPVDFQIQRQSHANRDFPNQPRHALGLFHWTPLDEAKPSNGGTSCRRCSECQGENHHWLEHCDDPEEVEGVPFAGYVCKHCDARIEMCDACDGPNEPGHECLAELEDVEASLAGADTREGGSDAR